MKCIYFLWYQYNDEFFKKHLDNFYRVYIWSIGSYSFIIFFLYVLKYYSERAEAANVNWKLRNILRELVDSLKVFLKYYSKRAEVANINWKFRNMLQELLDVVKVIWNMIESQPTLDKKKLEFLSKKRTWRDIWSTRGGGSKSRKK